MYPGNVAKADSQEWHAFEQYFLKQERHKTQALESFKNIVLENDQYSYTVLPEELFAFCTELVKIEMRNTYLEFPHENWLLESKIRHLEFAEIYDFQERFSKSLYAQEKGFLNITHLTIQRCNLKSIDSWICGLTNLEKLGLPENNIQEIPVQITQLVNLKKLDLYKNRISSIPEELCLHLTSLEVLALSFNAITDIPTCVFKLQNLSELCLAYNQLLELPVEISNITKLKILLIGHNQLTSLPRKFGNLCNLKFLAATGNPIADVPPEIVELGYPPQCCELWFDSRPDLKRRSNDVRNFGHSYYSRRP